MILNCVAEALREITGFALMVFRTLINKAFFKAIVVRGETLQRYVKHGSKLSKRNII